jgi:hypothetical protein
MIHNLSWFQRLPIGKRFAGGAIVGSLRKNTQGRSKELGPGGLTYTGIRVLNL